MSCHYPTGPVYNPIVNNVRIPLSSASRFIAKGLSDTRPDLWAVYCPQCARITGRLWNGTDRPVQPHYFGSRQDAVLATEVGIDMLDGGGGFGMLPAAADR